MNRRVISLDGEWEVAEGLADQVPERFPHTAPVPGLLDMATPAFADIGLNSDAREAFWYRRSFVVDGEIDDVAVLRIAKARYGTKVILNGIAIGEHRPNHTPAVFDVRDALVAGDNEILVRLGAWRDEVPTDIPDGRDLESYLAVPGIYDSVRLILTGSPFIEVVKTAPDIKNESLTVTARVRLAGDPVRTSLRCVIRESATGELRGEGVSEEIQLVSGDNTEITVEVPIRECRLWSPEDPFLYSLSVETAGDNTEVRFGMRTFTFDPETKHALLNGKHYPLRGSASVIFRFFEDPDRHDKPWRHDWVRKLHKQFKLMHWNTIRHAIGFPPELWYDIADEEGFLIVDEFPLFFIYTGDNQQVVDAAAMAEFGRSDRGIVHLGRDEPSTAPTQVPWPDTMTAETLVGEFTEWVEAHGNHPSVVIWNSNCESRTPETGKLIDRMKTLDPQGRPWGDGWNAPRSSSDPFGAHWYMQWNAIMKNLPPGLAMLAQSPKTPVGYPMGGTVDEMRLQLRTPGKVLDGVPVNYGDNPILLEEYGWLWLTRDGMPTRLSAPIYDAITEWPVATPEERQYTRARILAAETEFFRCNRTMAGVLLFCALTSSHPRVFTADNFVDLDSLDYDPNFLRYVGDAFAPVALMIDLWDRELAGRTLHEIPIVAINDEQTDWSGDVVLRVGEGDAPIVSLRRRVRIPALGQVRLFFALTEALPDGDTQIVAQLSNDDGYLVQSVRDITVVTRDEDAIKSSTDDA